MRISKPFIKICAVLISICILFTSCASSYPYTLSSLQIIDVENSDNKYHTSSGKNESVAKNEFIELLVDKNNHSVIVKDKQADHMWTALPEKNNNAAYAFGVTLYTKNGICNLNTQDHSVAISASAYKINNGILSVNYILSDKAETAKKNFDELTADDIYVSFTAVFSLNAQAVYLDIDLSQIKHSPKSFVSEISVMPYFGASYNDAENDYFLVPDGSGAVMHLATSDILTNDISVAVYGTNPYTENIQESAVATVPVFGAKRDSGAFSAIITDGDALSVVKANRADSEKPSRIFPTFKITDIFADETSAVSHVGQTYNGHISISYKFLSGNNANYSGMASAAKEEFITQGVLSSAKYNIDDTIPFFLTVVGEADNTELTTIQQTVDILGILKGKGISHINLNYKGLLSGGLSQKNLYNSSVNKKLGGKDGLNSLHEYTEKQNCKLILGINMMSSSKKYSEINKAESVLKNDSFFLMHNDLGFYNNKSNRLVSRIGAQAANLGKEKADASIYSQISDYTMYLMNVHRLESNFSSYIESRIISDIDGLAIADAGKILYSDSKTNRQESMNIISSLVHAISNYGDLTVEGGNLYTLYSADIVSNINFDTFYTESENYEPVPFVQSIIHGSMLYTGKPIDAGDPLYRYDMLRYIEYGAIPSYEWIYKSANIYCYSGYLLSEKITEIVDFYNDAAEIFTELADDNIINHRKITSDATGNNISGVYCTTYSDGTEIYVNYTGNIVTTNENIAIGPYDYVKVKR